MSPMGFLKQKQIEQYEKGYSWMGKEKYVCHECVREEALKEFVNLNAESNICDYCGTVKKKKNVSVPFTIFIDYIASCIGNEWSNPEDEALYYDKEDDEYYGASVYSTWELLSEVIELNIDSKELIDDIHSALIDNIWCSKAPYTLKPDEELISSWEYFTNLVKYEVRFVFFKFKTKKFPHSNPHKILKEVGNFINEFKLIKSIPENTIIKRGRIHNKSKKITNYLELGPPPKEKAKYSNRMSPAGIPLFYGAFDEDIVLSELLPEDEVKDETYITTGDFELLEEINVIDLTSIPKVPSLFEKERFTERWKLKFLNAFLYDFIKPITKDGREHIDYVPTQIVTEYFKHIFRSSVHGHPMGILYPSSKDISKSSLVLFYSRIECTQDKPVEEPEESSGNKVLELKIDSIKRIKLK